MRFLANCYQQHSTNKWQLVYWTKLLPKRKATSKKFLQKSLKKFEKSVHWVGRLRASCKLVTEALPLIHFSGKSEEGTIHIKYLEGIQPAMAGSMPPLRQKVQWEPGSTESILVANDLIQSGGSYLITWEINMCTSANQKSSHQIINRRWIL